VLLGHLGQQAQGGQPDQEPVRRRPGTQAERRSQGVGLWSREPFQAVQHRRQQLVQPSVGELHLRLDPGGARHPAARGVLDQVVQQGRLAHAWLAPDHQRLTRAPTHRVEEAVKHLRFGASTPQLRGISSPAGGSPSARHRHYGASTTPIQAPGPVLSPIALTCAPRPTPAPAARHRFNRDRPVHETSGTQAAASPRQDDFLAVAAALTASGQGYWRTGRGLATGISDGIGRAATRTDRRLAVRAASRWASAGQGKTSAGVIRWYNRVIAHAWILVTDRYPPFRLAE